jgi:hypothetical protein
MTKTIQLIKHAKNFRIQRKKILCMNNAADDDLHKIYFIESKYVKDKYYKVIATSFGATSCSCIDQTSNPYISCKHMKILDEILEESPHKIQKIKIL